MPDSNTIKKIPHFFFPFRKATYINRPKQKFSPNKILGHALCPFTIKPEVSK